MRGVRRAAREKASDGSPGVEDYWSAVVEGGGHDGEGDEDDDKSDDTEDGDENGPHIETHTTATAKGVVRTTITQPDPESSRPPTPQETVMAVGVGAQILPGKGEPGARETPREVARDALGEVQGAIDGVRGKADEAVDETIRRARLLREDVEEAGERRERRERVEGRRRGWKSRAFDL